MLLLSIINYYSNTKKSLSKLIPQIFNGIVNRSYEPAVVSFGVILIKPSDSVMVLPTVVIVPCDDTSLLEDTVASIICT